MGDEGRYKNVKIEKWLYMAYCQQLLDKWATYAYLSYSITACLAIF